MLNLQVGPEKLGGQIHSEEVAPVFVHEPPLKHGLAAHGSLTTAVVHNGPPKFFVKKIKIHLFRLIFYHLKNFNYHWTMANKCAVCFIFTS